MSKLGAQHFNLINEYSFIRYLRVAWQESMHVSIGMTYRNLKSSFSSNTRLFAIDSGIHVGPTFINFGYFQALCLINFWNFFQALQIFSSFSPNTQVFYQSSPYIYSFWHSFWAPHLFFLPNFLCPTFILFAKYSRPYVYSLPYVYSGV